MIDPLEHQGLLITIALKFRRGGVPLDDLIGWGQIGLLHACKYYDPNRGVQFSTYAGKSIKSAIYRSIRQCEDPVRIPEYLQALIREGVTEHPNPHKNKRLQEARRFLGHSSMAENQLGVPLAVLAIQSQSNEEEKRELAERARAILSKLPTDDADILRKRFGVDCEPMGNRAIAEEFGVHVNTIKWRVRRTIERLRMQHLGEKPRKFYRKSVDPCVCCGDPAGYINPGRKLPVRKSGFAFGFAGDLCLKCFDRYRYRAKRRSA